LIAGRVVVAERISAAAALPSGWRAMLVLCVAVQIGIADGDIATSTPAKSVEDLASCPGETHEISWSRSLHHTFGEALLEEQMSRGQRFRGASRL